MSTTATDQPVSPWERWSWAFAGIWLVFLTYPVIEVFQAGHSLPVTWLGVGLIATFAVVYVLGFGPLTHRSWLVLAALLVLAAALVPIIGFETIGLTPYLGVQAALQLPPPWWWRLTIVVGLLPLLSLLSDGRFPMFFFLMVWPILVGMSMVRVFSERQGQISDARAALALVEERERVARDVHDVLGHSLTALSVKAELAARLMDVDPGRARSELESIQETARHALAEVRATVGGLRAGNLDAEVAAAPRLLADAGVETIIIGAVADTDPRHRALLAWVLRESLTNVIRHAEASRVEIGLTPTGLVVTDDGRGIEGGPTPADGHGLTGMRERVAAVGGRLQISGSSGTRIEVTLP